MLRVHSIETCGTQDGPGVRMVVFLQGCHFRCLYCHNPDTWSLTGGYAVSESDIAQKARDQKQYFGTRGGVTISGGEPLVQREALQKLFTLLHADKIHTALDTNGYILDDHSKKLLETTDLVLLDIKHIDNEKHKRLTGKENTTPLEFAQYCEKSGVLMWLRYVLVPGINDREEDLVRWATHFSRFQMVDRVEILPYHTYGTHKYESMGLSYPLHGLKPPSKEIVYHAKKIFQKHLQNVYVR